MIKAKPVQEKVDGEKPVWFKYNNEEIESLIAKLAKDEKDPDKIGLMLRDTYGIYSVKEICNNSIGEIMKEKGFKQELPNTLRNLISNAVILRDHLEKNHHDMTAKRGLQLTEARIDRFAKYFKRKGELDQGWRYREIKGLARKNA